MKKSLLWAAAATMLAGCASDELVDVSVPENGSSHASIRFTTNQKNITRATPLQKAGHYNFGVFGYKSTDKVHEIMADYLVGYYDTEKGYGTKAGTTWGDPDGVADGLSYWMYEGMGSAEYNGTYAGQTVTPGSAFASNVENQYLRYWDLSADYTCFYAYAPYVNTTATNGKKVTYVDGQAVGTSTDTYVMTFPNGTIKHGYDLEDQYEFMYAWTKVAKADYGHDVALNFNRLNAKVNIKFWEDIPGYSVRIIDLNPTYSVSAVPAIKDNTSNNYGYKLGKIYSENGAKIKFYPAAGTDPTMKQYEGTTVSTPIKFDAPTAAEIGTTRVEATPSATTYYAIPKGSSDDVLSNSADKIGDAGTLVTDLAQTGLTFHVSYELISTTGEKITVKDATVFVPTDYTNWVANTHYTYIFKITKNSNGSTSGDVTPNPESPEVPTESGLYPIVFDNCTVEDWQTVETEHIITEGLALSYHNITLGTYSITTGAATDVTVEIADNDRDLRHPVDYEKFVSGTHESGISVSGPDANVGTWYNVSTKKIAVPSTAAAGLYTVTYTCPAGDVYANHPKTWKTYFIVRNAYTVSTNLDEVGTHGLANSALSISATKDGNSFSPAAAQLSIEYPENLSAAEKALVKVSSDGNKVEVDKTAAPGKYKLLLTIDEGVGVKVAEKVFEVKDYQFILSTYAVGLDASPVVINATCPGTGVLSMTTATGITVNDGAKTISVANTASEGTYTVTYTVQGTTVSEVQYQKTFTVANTYAVSLSKATISRDLGRANDAAQGTDAITITTLKNGEASNGETGKLKIKLGATDVTSSDFTITCVQAGSPAADTNTYTLKVNKTAAVNKTYTVEYTGQTGKVVTVDFTVQQ